MNRRALFDGTTLAMAPPGWESDHHPAPPEMRKLGLLRSEAFCFDTSVRNRQDMPLGEAGQGRQGRDDG